MSLIGSGDSVLEVVGREFPAQDWQSFIPAASCPLQADRENQAEETHNPTLNLAHAVAQLTMEKERLL